MDILSLSDLYKNIDEGIIELNNSSFFYISKDRETIPWYNIFPYYFYIINNKRYISDFVFRNVTSFFEDNNIFKNEICIDLLNNKDFNTIDLDKVIFIKFVHSNAGHAFSNIMNIIYKLKDLDLSEYSIIITEDLIKFSNFLTSIIYLFFNKTQVIIINDKTLVKFNKTFIIRDEMGKQEESINFLCDKIISNKNNIENYDTIKTYENIFLIKSTLTKNQNSLNKSFNNEYNEYFIEKGFTCIIPENYEINALFKIINNTKNVIMSWGCCSYLNSIFVNTNSNTLVICHIGYKDEYTEVIENYPLDILDSDWFPKKCNKKCILYDMETEFDDSIKIKLDEKIIELQSSNV
jgi:hypothetical protein